MQKVIGHQYRWVVLIRLSLSKALLLNKAWLAYLENFFTHVSLLSDLCQFRLEPHTLLPVHVSQFVSLLQFLTQCLVKRWWGTSQITSKHLLKMNN